MQIILDLYKISKKKSFQKIKGGWRVKAFLENLVRDQYFLFPYFEGKLWACPTHSSGIALINDGIYEPEIISIIRSLVSSGFSFVDIGANIGFHTIAAGLVANNPNQKIIAFEPEKKMFSILEKNSITNRLNNVVMYNEALGDEDSFLTLNVSTTKNKGINSFFESDLLIPGDKVRVSRIDTIFENNFDHNNFKIENLNFVIKIDTEGYEYPVIKGGVNWFSQLSDIALIYEINLEALEKFNKKQIDIFDLLTKAGFTNHFVIKNAETFTEDGRLRSNFYNLISIKGDRVSKILQNSTFFSSKCINLLEFENQEP